MTSTEQCFNKSEREQLLKLLSVREYKNGDFIIKQGEEGSEFFMIRTVRPAPRQALQASAPSADYDVDVM